MDEFEIPSNTPAIYNEFVSIAHLDGGVAAAFDYMRSDLIEHWIKSYRERTRDADISEIRLKSTLDTEINYLFDSGNEQRLIAVYGIPKHSEGLPTEKYRQSRINKGRNDDNRSHGFARHLGGRLDINVFSMNELLNKNAFCKLEREASNAPGSFYVVKLTYDGVGPRPDRIEQTLIQNRPPSYTVNHRVFRNSVI
jgi:hypothetical protein